MSKGYSGLFYGTSGRPAAGSLELMSKDDSFIKNIYKSNDIDTNGRFDVIAHGSSKSIQIILNGKEYEINHRTLAKLLKNKSDKKIVRLLSCNTGAKEDGFAQNLANKLNVIVEAPNKILWAYPSGKYFVASKIPGRGNPNFNDLGKFIKFYPGGNRNGKK